MDITVTKPNGRVATNNRETETLKVYVGSRSVKTNDKKRSRGQATVRLVTPKSEFVVLQLRAMLAAKLEHGKFYEIKGIVDVISRRDNTSKREVAEILEAKEIKPFKFEAKHVTYVQPEPEPEAAPEAAPATEEVEAPAID